MPMPDDASREAADRLNRVWDAVVLARRDDASREVHPGGADANGEDDPHPMLAAAVLRLHARDDAPAVDPAFAARLRRDLIVPAETDPAAVPARLAAGPRSFGLRQVGARRLALELVAAALLLGVLGGGLGGGNVLPGLRSGSPTVAAHEATPGSRAGSDCRASPTPAVSPSAVTPITAAPDGDGCR